MRVIQNAALVLGLLCSAAMVATRAGEAFPNHAIKFVVGFAAGGGTDVVGDSSPEMPFLNSRALLPRLRPISGSRFAPNSNRTMMSSTTMCQGWMSNDASFVRGSRRTGTRPFSG